MKITQIRTAAVFVAIAMLAACMAGAGVIEVATVTRKGLEPQPGLEETARVGDVLVTRFNYEARPVAVLQGDVAGNRWRMRTGFQRRDSLASVHSNAAYQPILFCEIPPRAGAVCLGDTDDDGRLDQSYALTVNGVGVELDRIDPVSYEMMEESTVGRGFKYELIYQGMANDVFRLSYREFKDDFARPAFAQDLTYTLDRSALPEVIAFRDLSIEVIEIERSTVTYRVVP